MISFSMLLLFLLPWMGISAQDSEEGQISLSDGSGDGVGGFHCSCDLNNLTKPVIALFGETGSGKSTLGNRLLGNKEGICSQRSQRPYSFGVGHSPEAETKRTRFIVGHYLGDPHKPCVTIMDTPGIGDTQCMDSNTEIAVANAVNQVKQVDAFVFVFKGTDNRFTESIADGLLLYRSVFGNELFTHAVTAFSFWGHFERDVKKRAKNGLNESKKHQLWNQEYQAKFQLQQTIPSVFIDPTFDEEIASPTEKLKFGEYTDKLWNLITNNSTSFQCDKLKANCESSRGSDVACYEVKLKGGNSSREGNVFINDQPVCSSHFDINAAQAACRTRGFSGATSVTSSIPLFLELSATGPASVHQTSRMGTYKLTTQKEETFPVWKKVGGTDLIYVSSAGHWDVGPLGYYGLKNEDSSPTPALPPQKWLNGKVFVAKGDIRDDATIKLTRHGGYGAVSDNFISENFNCEGKEENLLECSRNRSEICGSGQAADMDCFEMTLEGGQSSREGNLYLNGQPICDDSWDLKSATVACRMMGFKGAVSFTSKSKYGSVPVDFILDDINCQGDEQNVLDCSHKKTHNCKAGEGAGAVCYDLALKGWNSSLEGNVFMNNQPICHTNWNMDNAMVTCRMLGLTGAIDITSNSTYGAVPDNYILSDVDCEGNEKNLLECPNNKVHNCEPNQGAGVSCYELTLVGGSSPREGNIFLNGQPICDNGWSYNEANLACKSLGFTGAVRQTLASTYGEVPDNFIIDDVNCQGNEKSLLECSHNKTTNCAPTEAAGVECFDVGVSCGTYRAATCSACTQSHVPSIPQFLELSATGPASASHGSYMGTYKLTPQKKEMFPVWKKVGGGGSVFIYVLSGKWSVGPLGRYALRNEDSSPTPALPPQKWLNGKYFFAQGDTRDDATIKLTRQDITLAGGSSPGEGNVFLNGQPIHQDGWNLASAHVACRMMGFSTAEHFTKSSKYGPVSEPMSLNSFNCQGNETSLLECSHTTSNLGVHSSHGVGVVCRTECKGQCLSHDGTCIEKVKSGELRLVGGNTTDAFGNVFIGDFPICDDGWTDGDGEVVCRQLGFPGLESITRTSSFGSVGSEFAMNNVKCTGNETSLQDCKFSLYAGKCGPKDGAGVICKPKVRAYYSHWSDWSCDIPCYLEGSYRGIFSRKRTCNEGTPKHDILNCGVLTDTEDVRPTCDGIQKCTGMTKWEATVCPGASSGSDDFVKFGFFSKGKGSCDTDWFSGMYDYSPNTTYTSRTELGACSSFIPNHDQLQFDVKMNTKAWNWNYDYICFNHVRVEFGDRHYSWSGHRGFNTETSAWIPLTKH